MTKEEAINVLLKVRPCIIDNAQEDALDLAIEALSKFSLHSDLEEESEKPINLNEDLNFALDKYIGDLDEELHKRGCTYEFDWDDITETIREAGNYFAKWQKEQMMKEAVEAIISQCPGSNEIIFHNPSTVHSWEFPWNFSAKGLNKGDKVRIIIVKED